MAGFDAEFWLPVEDEPLVRQLIAAGRRRSRPSGVRWRSRLGADGYAYVSLDGNGLRLDMLLERFRRDLPAIAEGYGSGNRTPEQRPQLANGLVDILVRWRLMLYDRYGEGYIPRLRAKRKPVTTAMYDLFPREHEDLWPRMEVTLDVLSSWALGEVAPEVALEELHTAFELLLARSAGKARAPAFSELVDLADQQGRLGTVFTNPAIAQFLWDDPADAMSERELLISMKDQRKASKHQGSAAAKAWLDKHFWPTTTVLERLATSLPRARSRGGAK